MTVRRSESGRVVLEGGCPIDDAEPLLQLLLSDPQAEIDWTGCHSAHSGLVQIIMAAGRHVVGPPQGGFLQDYVDGALARAGV